MSTRIATLLETRGDRAMLIPYLTAGFPTSEETVDILLALEEGGADAVEVGLPFSDPLADGPVIQAASQRALAAGISHARVLEMVAAFRSRSKLPVILMGYVNPLLAFGPERFFREAVAAGVDGLIIPDLPTEEAETLRRHDTTGALSWIFLAAPTSSPERLARIDAMSTNFSYCVSVAGVTGVRADLPPELSAYLARAADAMQKPFVVGFGISRAEQVGRICPPAAGVVVGSALLRALDAERSAAGRHRRARGFLETLRGDA